MSLPQSRRNGTWGSRRVPASLLRPARVNLDHPADHLHLEPREKAHPEQPIDAVSIDFLVILHRDRGTEGGNIKGSPGERQAIALVQAMRDWGKMQRAIELRRLNECSDLPGNVLVRELTCQRREEVWLAIK